MCIGDCLIRSVCESTESSERASEQCSMLCLYVCMYGYMFVPLYLTHSNVIFDITYHICVNTTIHIDNEDFRFLYT